MAKAAENKDTRESTNDQTPEPIILDLGRQKSKRVKRLRKGRGRLMSDIMDATDHPRENGEIGEDAHVVVAVVRRKRRGKKWRRFPFI